MTPPPAVRDDPLWQVGVSLMSGGSLCKVGVVEFPAGINSKLLFVIVTMLNTIHDTLMPAENCTGFPSPLAFESQAGTLSRLPPVKIGIFCRHSIVAPCHLPMWPQCCHCFASPVIDFWFSHSLVFNHPLYISLLILQVCLFIRHHHV